MNNRKKKTEALWNIKRKKNVDDELKAMTGNLTEKDEKGRIKLFVSFDATWVTRGHHAAIGIGTYFGVYSGLPLFATYRCKLCKICESHKRADGASAIQQQKQLKP